MKIVRTILLLALIVLPATSFAATRTNPRYPDSDDCEADFIAFIGSNAYQFSPLLPGDLGRVRLFSILSYQSMADHHDYGRAYWKVEIRGPEGSDKLVRSHQSFARLGQEGKIVVEYFWDGRDEWGEFVAPGKYQYTFVSRFLPDRTRVPFVRELVDYDRFERLADVEVDEALASTDDVIVEYGLDVAASKQIRLTVATSCQIQQNTPMEATFGFNYYYGSTHSHSNFSDGGHPTTACGTGVQTGTFNPGAVYDYAKTGAAGTAGMDFWVVNEHNHLLDGGTSAVGVTGKGAATRAMYQQGRQFAATPAQHANGRTREQPLTDPFIAVYGMEWGIISSGGHMTLLETPALLDWECCTTSPCNSPTPVCAAPDCNFDVYTPQSDYIRLLQTSLDYPSCTDLNVVTGICPPAATAGSIAILNHPGSGDYGDLLGAAPFSSVADGALRGVAVRSGLATASTSCADTNVGATNYSAQWKKALDKGYHVAPVSDHDSHCNVYGTANPTRTVVLIDKALSPTLAKVNLLRGFRDRHVYATEDSNAQLVFRTTEPTPRIMGDIITVGGSITLHAAHYDPNGEAPSAIEIWRGQIGGGVPASAYAVDATPADGVFQITETIASGTYYYYAHLVQVDGHDLWSAPMWITYGGVSCTDVTAPAVSIVAPTAGATIVCSNTVVQVSASDAAGIASVQVRIDGGTFNNATFNAGSGFWEYTWNSRSAANGAHTIDARATDSSCNSNVGNAPQRSVTVDNSTCPPPSPVRVLTTTSKSTENKVEWVNPSSGTYSSTMIRFRTDGSFPTGPTDGTLLVSKVGALGAKDSTLHSALTNGMTYSYAAFVNDGAGTFSTSRTAAGTPRATSGNWKWSYSTGASALTPPTLNGSAFGVSNDRIVHAMNLTATGGDWPASWLPPTLNASSQTWSPVWNVSVGRTLFAGAQDGRVYAVNADSGAVRWTSPLLGEAIQAVLSAYIPAWDTSGSPLGAEMILVATRNAASSNKIYALNSADGTIRWSWDNGAAGDATRTIGVINGGLVSDPTAHRLWFTSRKAPGGSIYSAWALDYTAAGGTLRWAADMGDADVMPIRRGTRVYVGNNTGVAYGFDAAALVTPNPALWSFATSDGAVKSIVMPDWSGTRVYFSTTNRVWCLNDTNGTQAGLTNPWSTAASGVGSIDSPSRPVLASGYLFVGSGLGEVVQLSNLTAPAPSILTLPLGTAAAGSPSVDFNNSIVHLGAEDGLFHALTFPFACTPPSAPTVTTTPGNNQVRVNWTAVAGATSYNVYRATGACPAGPGTAIATGVTGTSYVDTTAVNGTTYAYRVTAVNGCESASSACVNGTPVAGCTPTELFISEYVEGSSNNKSIEIYNGTGATVNLAAGGYKLEFYFNGSATAGTTINLTGTALASGAVWVVSDDSSAPAILALTNQTSNSSFFNGDDAIVLRKGTTIIDAIGDVGFDPGTEWGTGVVSTMDNTIRRKAAVCAGDTNATNAFDPAPEWDGFAVDTFGGLGLHP